MLTTILLDATLSLIGSSEWLRSSNWVIHHIYICMYVYVGKRLIYEREKLIKVDAKWAEKDVSKSRRRRCTFRTCIKGRNERGILTRFDTLNCCWHYCWWYEDGWWCPKHVSYKWRPWKGRSKFEVLELSFRTLIQSSPDVMFMIIGVRCDDVRGNNNSCFLNRW